MNLLRLVASAALFMLAGCSSTSPRVPASTPQSPEAAVKAEAPQQEYVAAILAEDAKHHRLCLVNHSKYNLRAQAIGSSLILPYADARKFVKKEIPNCSEAVSAKAQKLAAVSYSESVQTASPLLIVPGYYLVCSLANLQTAATEEFKANKNYSEKARSIAEAAAIPATWATIMPCLPVTFSNVMIADGIYYVFTGKHLLKPGPVQGPHDRKE